MQHELYYVSCSRITYNLTKISLKTLNPMDAVMNVKIFMGNI